MSGDQLDLFRVGHAGPNPPRHRTQGRQTSATAAASLDPGRVATRCERYLSVIVAAGSGGATRDDVAAAVDARGAEDRALARRITDLCQAGLVVDSGRTRPGESGRPQTVWVAA